MRGFVSEFGSIYVSFIMKFFISVLTYLYWVFRPCIKWFLRKTTKLCELQRICYGEPPGYSLSHGVELSLSFSKNESIQSLVAFLNEFLDEEQTETGLKSVLDKSILVVLNAKDIDPIIHRQFIQPYTTAINHIWGYKHLFNEIEYCRLDQYDSENKTHETKLLNLWTTLKRDTPLTSRVSKQWTDIGFQGDDPKTDFRGMGLLGLENLIYFAEQYPGPAGQVLSHSLHPTYGYAFAIVGINLTSMAYHLFKDGTAKTHVYNVSTSLPSMKIFHHFYCYLFIEFDRFWLLTKPNIMEFSFVRDKFENNVRAFLSDPLAVCEITNVSVGLENI